MPLTVGGTVGARVKIHLKPVDKMAHILTSGTNVVAALMTVTTLGLLLRLKPPAKKENLRAGKTSAEIRQKVM